MAAGPVVHYVIGGGWICCDNSTVVLWVCCKFVGLLQIRSKSVQNLLCEIFMFLLQNEHTFVIIYV